jgi:hypothetical protein
MNKIKSDDIVLELKIVNGEIFDNCAAYIKEDYIDLDLNVNNDKTVEPKVDKVNDILNSKFNDDLRYYDNNYDYD